MANKIHVGSQDSMGNVVEITYEKMRNDWLTDAFIASIRDVRSITKMGLKEAKKFVEKYRNHYNHDLNRFTFTMGFFDEFYNYLVKNCTYVWTEKACGCRQYIKHSDPSLIYKEPVITTTNEPSKLTRFAELAQELATLTGNDPFNVAKILLNALDDRTP